MDIVVERNAYGRQQGFYTEASSKGSRSDSHDLSVDRLSVVLERVWEF